MSVETYLRQIRNPRKKMYAQRYWAWLQSGELGEPPEPEKLSVMAAQAVRIALNSRRKP